MAVASMPTAKGKIPRIVFGAFQPIRFGDKDWVEFEAAYGRSIPPETRENITVATNRFLKLAEAENTGLMKDAVKRAEDICKRAKALIAIIDKRHVGDVTRDYVDDEIADGFASIRIGESDRRFPRRGYISFVRDELSRLVFACEFSLEKLADASQHNYWPDGRAWEDWINDLTYILDSRGLTAGVRKDTDKNKNVFTKGSPFVELVRAFQEKLPRKYCATMSRTALASAIDRARTRPKPLVKPK